MMGIRLNLKATWKYSVTFPVTRVTHTMPRGQSKTGYFVIEGLNSFAVTFYFYYLYFFMQKQFGFGNKANLLVAAANGLIYVCFAWWGGRFAQRHGYSTALKTGLLTMMIPLSIGSQLHSLAGHLVVMAITAAGMSCSWPALEALTSENESRKGLRRAVGIYNVVWSATAALAYFTGGAVLEKFGLRSLFYVPVAIQCVQLGLALRLERRPRHEAPSTNDGDARDEISFSATTPARAKTFLRMSWLANPFAYIAINTLVAVVPGIAGRLELSTMAAGFCCSVWCFSRLGAFVVLWYWEKWHYRFRWLLISFIILIGTFAVILTVPNLATLVGSQNHLRWRHRIDLLLVPLLLDGRG